MNIEKVKTSSGQIIENLLLINPKVFCDKRGFFFESWNDKVFKSLIDENINFVQDNHSRSEKGVLRGLHYQLKPMAQGKLVRCTKGEIFDVAIDLRKGSKTYRQYFGKILDDINKTQLWIPTGFAHGFLTLSEVAEVQYKTTNFWSKEFERSIIWNDSTLAINWPLNEKNIVRPIVSEKDSNSMTMREAHKTNNIFL